MLLACCTHKISLIFYLFVSGNGTRCWRIYTVKILALDSPRDLDVVIDLLKCFPCVEKLYMVGFHLVTFYLIFV